MKSMLVSLATAVLLASSLALAGGGSSAGNGGGGLLVNGEYKTFGELGLDLTPVKPYDVKTDPKILKELFFIIDRLKPYVAGSRLRALQQAILGESAIYRYLSVVDPEKFRWLEEKYRKELGGSDLPQGEFKLYAITGENWDETEPGHRVVRVLTDVLPDFFQLDPPSQALILFHEALFRLFPAAQLRDVVAAETEIHRLAHLGAPDPTLLFQALNRIGFFDQGELVGHYVQYLARFQGVFLSLRDIASDLFHHWTDTWVGHRAGTSTDAEKIFRLLPKHPAMLEILSNVAFYTNQDEWDEFSAHSVIHDSSDDHLGNLVLSYSDDGGLCFARLKDHPVPPEANLDIPIRTVSESQWGFLLQQWRRDPGWIERTSL
jgi:hypothetical protein